MPPELVKVRLLEPQRLFHIGSEVLVTADVAKAWCTPGRGTAEYVDPPAVEEPPKKRGRPKKQDADDEPPPAPLGLSTQDMV